MFSTSFKIELNLIDGSSNDLCTLADVEVSSDVDYDQQVTNINVDSIFDANNNKAISIGELTLNDMSQLMNTAREKLQEKFLEDYDDFYGNGNTDSFCDSYMDYALKEDSDNV